ncbi:hypothetical protein ACQJBY_069745 [Aegilops geniculata]
MCFYHICIDELIRPVYLYFIWKGASLVIQIVIHVTQSIIHELNHTKCQWFCYLGQSYTSGFSLPPCSTDSGNCAWVLGAVQGIFQNVHMIIQNLLGFLAYNFLNILIGSLT